MPKLHVLVDTAILLENAAYLERLTKQGITRIILVHSNYSSNGKLSSLLQNCQERAIVVDGIISPEDCRLVASQDDPTQYLGKTYEMFKAADTAAEQLLPWLEGHYSTRYSTPMPSTAIRDDNDIYAEIRELIAVHNTPIPGNREKNIYYHIYNRKYEQYILQKLIARELLNPDIKIRTILAILEKPVSSIESSENELYIYTSFKNFLRGFPKHKYENINNLTIGQYLHLLGIDIDSILSQNDIPDNIKGKIIPTIEMGLTSTDHFSAACRNLNKCSIDHMLQRCKIEGRINQDDAVVFIKGNPYFNSEANDTTPVQQQTFSHFHQLSFAQLTIVNKGDRLGLIPAYLDLLDSHANALSKQADGHDAGAAIRAVKLSLLKIHQKEPEKDTELLTILQEVISAIENPTPANIAKCKTHAEQAQGQASALWQGLGIALMILGTALIILGALVATGTVGLASIPGAMTIAAGATATSFSTQAAVAGGVSLISGFACSFFGRTRGLAKELDKLSTALEKFNSVQKSTNDATMTPLLQKS